MPQPPIPWRQPQGQHLVNTFRNKESTTPRPKSWPSRPMSFRPPSFQFTLPKRPQLANVSFPSFQLESFTVEDAVEKSSDREEQQELESPEKDYQSSEITTLAMQSIPTEKTVEDEIVGPAERSITGVKVHTDASLVTNIGS